MKLIFNLFNLENSKSHLPRSKKKIVKKNLYKEKRLEKRKLEHKRRRINKKNNENCGVITCQNLQICIDLDFYYLMSEKEKGKLFRQLCRVWGLQKKFSGLDTTLLNGSEDFYNKGNILVSGFDKFNWRKSAGNLKDVFENKVNFVYLSPDPNCKPILEIDDNTVYVIGGLVDESGVGSKTLDKANSLSLECKRLPIKEFMKRDTKGTYNEMLSINLVVEFLCKIASGNSVKDSLSEIIPKRIGYI
uniref:SAM-dependent MTase TRM10-type domain-containing protein n=1 Tax=Parastrongyloides trichosuri TaxID=131310 RepID=A0A0N5A269_PARTI